MQSSILRISPHQESYPALLKPLSDKPKQLFYIGTSPSELGQCIAVIGTRTMTSYGQYVTDYFVRDLIAAGFTIVSGLALGVDGAAHRAALKYGGKTVAVLAHGLDHISPTDHTQLAQEIIQSGGTLISEHPSGKPALKYSFRQRNRIIAGISLGVLIIEAGVRSGTQITARFAADYGRPVFAVPGPITNQYSEGTKMFVNNGAKLVTSIGDIMEELFPQLPLYNGDFNHPVQDSQFERTETPKLSFETDTHVRIYTCLKKASATADDIALETGYDITHVQSTLIELEILGFVTKTSDNEFCVKLNQKSLKNIVT